MTLPRLTDLDASFFEESPVEVAPRLLGCFVTHAGVTGRITEVEAYHGAQDPGSHGFRRRTERNAALFGPPGTAYVYINYGIHRALNLVCGRDGESAGCLLRALEIVEGMAVASARRGGGSRPIADHALARGPGNVAKAFAIETDLNGTSVVGAQARVRVRCRDDSTGEASTGYETGPRVGVSGPGGDAADYPWRFWLPGEPSVSAYRAATPRRRPLRTGATG